MTGIVVGISVAASVSSVLILSSPSWSLVKRVLFRFAFSYLVLYNLPFPLHRIPWAGPIITQPYKDLWNWLAPKLPPPEAAANPAAGD